MLPGSMRTSNDEHKAILDALRQGDCTAAARLLERHILAGKARFLRTLEDDSATDARRGPLDPRHLRSKDR
ncbi:FCD domain-containing protein [Ancylobacter dichloromethanicus]